MGLIISAYENSAYHIRFAAGGRISGRGARGDGHLWAGYGGVLAALGNRVSGSGVRYHLGMAYLQVGEKQLARVALKKALNIKDNFPEAEEAKKALRELHKDM